MSEPATRQPIALRVLAAWPALTPFVMFAIAEIVQLVQHVKQMIVAKNFAPGNAGGVFVADVAVPIFLIVLYLTYH